MCPWLTHETTDGGHGRIERRRIWTTEWIDWVSRQERLGGPEDHHLCGARAPGGRTHIPGTSLLHQRSGRRAAGADAGLHPGALGDREPTPLVPGREKTQRRRRDSNPRLTDLQSVPLVHLGTPPNSSLVRSAAHDDGQAVTYTVVAPRPQPLRIGKLTEDRDCKRSREMRKGRNQCGR